MKKKDHESKTVALVGMPRRGITSALVLRSLLRSVAEPARPRRLGETTPPPQSPGYWGKPVFRFLILQNHNNSPDNFGQDDRRRMQQRQ
ncbi:MAG TPA: hypothetical protein VK327_08385 [Candidatus Paceibacterota bacterium]|nr:hypothetical protein [Candidatus Paceibacterota bacterium]